MYVVDRVGANRINSFYFVCTEGGSSSRFVISSIFSLLPQGNVALSAVAGVEGHAHGQDSRQDPGDIGKDEREAVVVVCKHG